MKDLIEIAKECGVARHARGITYEFGFEELEAFANALRDEFVKQLGEPVAWMDTDTGEIDKSARNLIEPKRQERIVSIAPIYLIKDYEVCL